MERRAWSLAHGVAAAPTPGNRCCLTFWKLWCLQGQRDGEKRPLTNRAQPLAIALEKKKTGPCHTLQSKQHVLNERRTETWRFTLQNLEKTQNT